MASRPACAASTSAIKAFEQEHRRRYGYCHPHREIELVTLRLRAILKSTATDVGADTLIRPPAKRGANRTHEAQVLYDGKKSRTKIYAREDLTRQKKYSGPAIITEYSATTLIPPGWKFTVDSAANLIMAA